MMNPPQELKQPLIAARSVSKSYRCGKGIVHALQHVNLTVQRGDIFGIIGPSGAGKSTLLRCLIHLLKPSSGHIYYNGRDVSELEGKDLLSFRMKMGMIFQHFNLFSARTVAENIAYPLELAGMPPEEIKRRVDELLALVGLSDKRDAYPATLSGGQKQRVGIARALANSPEVLFCDEATSALDPRTTRDILDLLKKINQTLGLTIVLITHDMEVIKRICHRVAVIDGGKIVEEGSVFNLFANPLHPTTKHFIQSSSHEIPETFFKERSEGQKLLRLKFMGTAASEPLISQIVKLYHVDANILLGWIDHLQTASIGTLIVELTGSAEGIAGALDYLTRKSVSYDILEGYAS